MRESFTYQVLLSLYESQISHLLPLLVFENCHYYSFNTVLSLTKLLELKLQSLSQYFETFDILQIFLSPQMKRSVIISNKDGI